MVNGRTYASGRLEIYHDNVWGTICGKGFHRINANVACVQLGFYLGALSFGNNYGAGSGKIWLDNISCRGNEFQLWHCSSSDWGNNNCSHREDVGVTCADGRPM